MESRNTKGPNPRGPWASGSFYLVVLVVVMAMLIAVAYLFRGSIVVVLIAGALLLITIIGAFQLRQDGRLSGKLFIKLMTLAFRQFSVLRLFKNGDMASKPPHD